MRLRTFLLGLSLALLAATGLGAKPPYIVAGASFKSAEQLFLSYRGAWNEQLGKVTRGQYYGGSLLLVLPPDSALISPAFIGAYRPDFDDDSKRVYRLWYDENAQTTLEAINKAGLFDSATRTRIVGYWKYASDFGYRYVLAFVGRPDGMKLADMVTREEVVVSYVGEGLPGLMNGIEQALDKLARGQGTTAVAAAPAPIPAAPPVAAAEEMHYDEQTRRGWVSVRGRGLAAREMILRRIAEICATKNKLLVSDDLAAARGAFKVHDEELKDGVLKVSFEALY
jgi:hypothetical protein